MHNAVRYALGAFAGAAIISGAGIGVALAGDDGGSPATAAPAIAAQEGPVDGFIARLAANLGIDEARLREAIEQTLSEEVEAAADEGTLPRDLADKIQDEIDEGLFDGEGIFGGGWSAFPGTEEIEGDLEQLQQEIADFLGITEAEVRERLDDGETLAEIAESLDKTPEEIGQFLLQKYLEFLNNEDVPVEVRDQLKEITNRLIELWINGEIDLDELFEGGWFDSENP